MIKELYDSYKKQIKEIIKKSPDKKVFLFTLEKELGITRATLNKYIDFLILNDEIEVEVNDRKKVIKLKKKNNSQNKNE